MKNRERIEREIQEAKNQKKKSIELVLYTYSEYVFLEKMGYISWRTEFSPKVKRKSISFPYRIIIKL